MTKKIPLFHLQPSTNTLIHSDVIGYIVMQ